MLRYFILLGSRACLRDLRFICFSTALLCFASLSACLLCLDLRRFASIACSVLFRLFDLLGLLARMNSKNSTRWQQSCHLVEFLVFNSALLACFALTMRNYWLGSTCFACADASSLCFDMCFFSGLSALVRNILALLLLTFVGDGSVGLLRG